MPVPALFLVESKEILVKPGLRSGPIGHRRESPINDLPAEVQSPIKAIPPRQQSVSAYGFRCKLPSLVLAFLSLLLFHSLVCGTEFREKKQVLILFPSQSDLPAYPLVEQGIRSSLDAGTEFDIEYFVEYMDCYRNPGREHQQLLADLYHQTYSRHKIDLVIAYGAPSLEFVIAHSDDLFPRTPVVFSGVPRKQLEGLNLHPEITGVLADIDYAGLLETALRIHPQTRHVAIVNGASQTDLLLEKEFRKALEPYARQLDFIDLTRLPFGKIQERVRNLPEHSVILFYLLTQDGEGKAFVPRQAASLVAKFANAPVYGCLDSYFGHGIVGGRLTSMEMTGVKAGEMALRILRGENPANIPMSGQGTIINQFDWRQFKRFGIGEERLPPDSIVRFKTPSFWERYHWYIVTAAVLLLVQSGLISFLLVQRVQRRRAQALLAERLSFEEMLSALSARFVNLRPDEVETEIKHVLESIGRGLEVDRVSVFVTSAEDQRLHLVHAHKNEGIAAFPDEFKFEQLPWTRENLFENGMIAFAGLENLPAEAVADRDFLSGQGIVSLAVIALSTGEKTLGALSLAMLRQRKTWPDELIRRCRLVAEVIANALERKRHEESLIRAYTENEQLKNQLEAETAYLQAEIKLAHNFENIVGTSAALKYVLYKVEQIAAADSTVLVLGESGTGKELIARAIHNKSPRGNRALVKVNCATLPADLIESELFGHERGAFTGAQDRQLGRFEVADGTSIFLDEIGELPLELQTKLLRVLQDREFERLGSSRTIKVDVRVIAATNRDLEEEVRKGRFREDLYFRLNVFPITVPPLRQRRDDIPLLVRFFVEKASKRLGKSIDLIQAGVMQKLQDYPWPGNVRELENVIERAVINSSGPKLCLVDDLTGSTRDAMNPALESLQEVEKEHILRVLQSTNWRIEGAKGASRILDINPSTLRSRMRKLRIRKA